MERKKHYIFGLLDDCTRLCYLELIDRPTAANVSQAFSRGYKWFNLHGIKPEEVMTDNGLRIYFLYFPESQGYTLF